MLAKLKAITHRNEGWAFGLFAITAAFLTYFAMYAFRKPFSVGRFDQSLELFGLVLDMKIVYVFSQVLGYTFSKFIGIKLVSESGRHRRIRMILLFIGFAELSLLAFAVCPPSLRVLCLFANGLPLGMVRGLVFSFLEGRHNTEVLAAGLSTSYIVASGFVKSAGKWVLLQGVCEYWMPVITGLLFIPMLLLGLWMLSRLPPPSQQDEALRTKRAPMHHEERKRFFRMYAPGLIALTGFYMLLTAYRDIRDNFSRDLWDELGFGDSSMVFSTSELPIAFIVLMTLSFIMYIKSNRTAVTVIHGLLVGDSALIGLATLAFQMQWISPYVWLTSVGLGLYLGYVPFGSVIFDRIIAETKFIGTAAFMIYVTDAFGYLGSFGVMFYKNFMQLQSSWLDFFIAFSYTTSIACVLGYGFSMVYFHQATRNRQQ